MRVTGLRDFRNRVPSLVKGEEVIFITRHGKLSGILVPMTEPGELPLELRRELLQRIGAAISDHLKTRGIGEQKVLRDFEAWRKKARAGRRR